MADLSCDRESLAAGVPAGVADRLALLLVRSGDHIAGIGATTLRDELGIDGRHYTALAVIAEDRPTSQLELARLMGKAPALCVGILDDLESAGLVERVRDPSDRRRSIVKLTAAGHDTLKRADAIAERVTGELFPGLSDALRAELTAALAGRVLAPADAATR